LHSGGGSDDELKATAELVERCEAAGLPSAFQMSQDHQYRVMRMAFLDGATSMTMDGAPAVAHRFPGLPGPDALDDLGDVLLYHYPSTWSLLMGDHAVTFRMLPTGPATTELRTTWLVPGEAVEGVDYDVAALTKVWLATNDQDSALVARAQRGVSSPAFRPGPYSPDEEEGVIQFVDWYARVLHGGLDDRPAPDR
jgi:phenylpropionate dioxygenase-like ring-hydroxylating dioxygenase large terminal subunit